MTLHAVFPGVPQVFPEHPQSAWFRVFPCSPSYREHEPGTLERPTRNESRTEVFPEHRATVTHNAKTVRPQLGAPGKKE